MCIFVDYFRTAVKVTFLGTSTSQGVPVIACECGVCLSNNLKDKRLRSSVLIETDDLTIVIDSGPDFRQQMLHEKVKKLSAILFTHEHKDHISGADDIRSFNWITGKPMDVYAEKRVLDAIKYEYSYVFADEKYPGIPRMELHPVINKIFRISGLEIIPVRAFHHNLPVFGYRINNFAYLTDINYVPAEELKKLHNLDILVVNALRKSKHTSHFNLAEAIEFSGRISPRKTFLTHISHYMGFHDEVSKELPENVHLAYDGLQLTM